MKFGSLISDNGEQQKLRDKRQSLRLPAIDKQNLKPNAKSSNSELNLVVNQKLASTLSKLNGPFETIGKKNFEAA